MQAAPQAAAGWIRVEEPVEDRFQLTVAGLLGCSSPKARKFEWHRVYCIVASGTLRWSAREGGTPLCSVPCSLYSVRVDARLGPNNVELTVQEFGTAPRSVIRLHADSPAKAARWAHVIRANGAVSDGADAAAAAASPEATIVEKPKKPAATAASSTQTEPLAKPPCLQRPTAGGAGPEDEDPHEGTASLADSTAQRPDADVASVTSATTEGAAALAVGKDGPTGQPEGGGAQGCPELPPAAMAAASGEQRAAAGAGDQLRGKASHRALVSRCESDPSMQLPAGLESPWADASASDREGDLEAIWSASEAEAAAAAASVAPGGRAASEEDRAGSGSPSTSASSSDRAVSLDRLRPRDERLPQLGASGRAASALSEHLPGHLSVGASSSCSLPPALSAECAAALGLDADSGWDLTGVLVAMPGTWDPALRMGRWFVRRALVLTVTGPCVGLTVGPAATAPGGGDAEGCGAVVSSISAASPLHGALLPGDRIVAIAGSAILATPWQQACRRFETAVAAASAAAPVPIVIQTSTLGKAVALRRARTGAFLAPARTPHLPEAPRSGRFVVDGGIVLAQPPSPSAATPDRRHRAGASSGFSAAAADVGMALPTQERTSRDDDDGDSVASVELDEASHGGLPAAWFSPRQQPSPCTPGAGGPSCRCPPANATLLRASQASAATAAAAAAEEAAAVEAAAVEAWPPRLHRLARLQRTRAQAELRSGLTSTHRRQSPLRQPDRLPLGRWSRWLCASVRLGLCWTGSRSGAL